MKYLFRNQVEQSAEGDAENIYDELSHGFSLLFCKLHMQDHEVLFSNLRKGERYEQKEASYICSIITSAEYVNIRRKHPADICRRE